MLKLYYVGNQDSFDIKVQIMKAAMFGVSEVLSMCYNSYFNLSEDESSCDEGEGVHACRGPRLVAAVTSECIASSSASIYINTEVSTDAEDDQGQFQGQ